MHHFVMVGTDYRMIGYLARAFYHPIAGFLFIKTTGIAYKFFYLTINILTGGYTQYIFTFIPKRYFTIAPRMIAFTVRFYRFGKPNTVTETKSFVSQCTYGAYIDHVSGEIVINCSLDVGRYF